MIDVMEAAEHRLADDICVARFTDWLIHSTWGALTHRAVWAPAVEIVHVFRQQLTQLAPIEDEHVVQGFSIYFAGKPL